MFTRPAMCANIDLENLHIVQNVTRMKDGPDSQEQTGTAERDIKSEDKTTGPVHGLKGNFSIGGNIISGNTKRKETLISAEAARMTGHERYTLRYLFNYAEDEDEVLSRNTFGELKYDHFFKDKLYGYIGAEVLNDKFKDLRLRTATGPGIGHQIWDNNVKSLLVEEGLVYVSEDMIEGDDKREITARLGMDFKYKITDTVTFSDHFVIYPDIDHIDEYRLRNETVLLSSYGQNWSLRLSGIFERNSNPPDDIKKNDWMLVLGLQYTFNH